MAYVLAGGRGSRLLELTDVRAKPAVYFGGKFRIIDFALSNALNSGIRRIAVATQYKAHSLIRHLQRGWNFFRPERNETFDILPASQRVSEENWYLGTADAVFQNIDIVQDYEPALHRRPGRRPRLQDGLRADAAAARRAGRRRDRRLHRGAPRGGLRLRRHGTSTPPTASSTSSRSRPIRRPCRASPTAAWPAWASMCSTPSSWPRSCAATPPIPNSSHDFGKDIIPRLVKDGKAVAHPFAAPASARRRTGRPTGATSARIDSYFAANIDLTEVVPDLDLYDRNWPIWTYSEMNAPAKFVHDYPGRRGSATASLVAGGCVVSGASVWRSLLFNGVRINSYSSVELARGAAGRRDRPLGASCAT